MFELDENRVKDLLPWIWVVVASSTAGGLIALFCVVFLWGKVKDRYRGWIPGIAIPFLRMLLAGFAAFGVISIDDPDLRADWNASRIMAIVSLFLWELSAAIGNVRFQRSMDELANESRRLARDGLRRTQLIGALHELLNAKRERIRTHLLKRELTSSVQYVKDGLHPSAHCQIIIEDLAHFFRLTAPQDAPVPNFRVGLYVKRGGKLTPRASVDLRTQRNDPFSAADDFPRHFELSSTEPALVVRCLQVEQMFIVESCQNDPDFTFYKDGQRNYLRSMVAFPIPHFFSLRDGKVRAALAVDTDCDGFFRKADQEMLRTIFNEYAARIEL
jgi:hypothetical protein